MWAAAERGSSEQVTPIEELLSQAPEQRAATSAASRYARAVAIASGSSRLLCSGSPRTAG